MKILDAILGSVPSASPGVYELRRRELRRVSTLNDYTDAAQERDDLLGSRTEIVFNKLYNAVARKLATTFYVALELTEDDLGILSKIAEQANVDLADQGLEVTESDIDEVIWRNAARAATLTLFDHLVASTLVSSPLILSDSEWVDRVLHDKRFNADRVARSGDLAEEEVSPALRAAANAITEWERFLAPGEHIRYQGINLFLLADEGSHKFHCFPVESSTIAFVEGELRGEDDNVCVFDATESLLMPVGGRLYWAENGDKVTVAAGDTEYIAPRELSLSLTMNDGAKPTVREHVTVASGNLSRVLGFRSPAGGSFAVPKEEVQQIAGNQFLLRS